MKCFMYLVIAVLLTLMIQPVLLFCAPASVPTTAPTPTKPAALPKVPIKYATDTDKTIMRRAQWVEGAKKERSVVWWGTLGPKDVGPIITKFNKIYPFIKIDYWRGGSAEVGAKMEAEFIAGRCPLDVALGGTDNELPRFRKMGMLVKFVDIIPGVEKMDKRMYGKYGDYSITGHSVMIPLYNTNLVSSAEAPKSWEDLVDPKWKGQMGMAIDMAPWVGLAVGDGGWGVEKTEDFLSKMSKQQIKWGTSLAVVRGLLKAGEIKIDAAGMLHRIYEAQRDRSPVGWVRANPVVLRGAPLILLEKALHPNAARLLVEWLNSPVGLAAFEEVLGRGPAFPGSGTRQAKDLEGLQLVPLDEDAIIKGSKLGLYDRFPVILGIVPK